MRQLSSHDRAQDAQLAQVIIRLDTVEGKVDVVHGVALDIKGALAKPLARQALRAVAVLLIAAATTVAGYTAGHEQQAPKMEQSK